MKKTIFFATLVILMSSFSFISSDDKDLKSKDVKISEFHSVEVSSGIDLYITSGKSDIATIKTKEKYLDEVIVKNEGNTLVVKLKGSFHFVRGPIKVFVKADNLQSVRSSGGSDVYCEDGINCETLNIVSSGGSDVKMTVNAQSINIDSSGGSDVILKGTAVNCSVECSGGSDVLISKLITENCTVNSSGGSDAIVYASKSITVNASGGSDVIYSGNPEQRNINASSSSDVCSRK